MNEILLKVKRQDGPGAKPYWEVFCKPHKPGYNVVSLLQAIRKDPINREGKRVPPPEWECNCMEEVCGACAMIVNKVPRQACSTLVDSLKQPIVLEPLSKFPVVRDLVVDRKGMFESLKRIHGWVDVDGSHDLGRGPLIPQETHKSMYKLSMCMTCGCCLEACPQVNRRSPFMGPSALAQITLFNDHPTGKQAAKLRAKAVMGPDGVANCANAQNCEKVCPKSIPLVSTLSKLQRQVLLHGVLGMLNE